MPPLLLFIILTVVILCFTYVNGFHDGCNSVATLITSRAMEPKHALALAAVVEFLTPFVTIFVGANVAKTIQGIVKESSYVPPAGAAVTQQDINVALAFVTAGIVAAIAWNVFTWRVGLPASSSHALVGGVLGSGIAAYGFSSISWNSVLVKVVLMVFLTPVVSFIVGFLLMSLIKFLVRRSSPVVNTFFKRFQIINMAFLAFNHSLNDSQKSMGIIMLLASVMHFTPINQFNANIANFMRTTLHLPVSASSPPVWAVACTGLALALGISFGGFKIIRTVGTGIYRVQPIDSFTSQLASGFVILGSSIIGAPVSTSQIVSSSIMGVGSAERFNAVRWGVVKNILFSWVITLPAVALVGVALFNVFRFVF